jgi:hypothetical protein
MDKTVSDIETWVGKYTCNAETKGKKSVEKCAPFKTGSVKVYGQNHVSLLT